MIKTFADKDTAKLFRRERVTRYQGIEIAARKALIQLTHAQRLEDIARIPGNRLEKLPEYGGKYGLRINRQFRLLFNWKAPDAFDVEIKDYHD